MFDLKDSDMNLKSDRLLFNIWQELKAIRILLGKSEPAQPTREATEVKEYRCKYCGDKFESGYKMASHMGKCPKKEGK